MPKILPGLRLQLIETTKRLIMEEGSEQLSIRRLAKECNIATGTVYNYFKNKEELFVGVILEGWHSYQNIMDEQISSSQSYPEALANIVGCIENFAKEYRSYWQQFGGTNGVMLNMNYHIMLRNQINERVLAAMDRFGKSNQVNIVNILSEAILASASRLDMGREDIYNLAKRLN